VLRDANDDTTVISRIDRETYRELKESRAIFAGMIPKLDNAFAALQSGVRKVIIGKAERLHDLINGDAGTTITDAA
jgi:acetylglutamate kinase